jgi:hypothetical protein
MLGTLVILFMIVFRLLIPALALLGLKALLDRSTAGRARA